MDTPDEGTIPIDYYQNSMYVSQDYIKDCMDRTLSRFNGDLLVRSAFNDLFNTLIGNNEETGFEQLYSVAEPSITDGTINIGALNE